MYFFVVSVMVFAICMEVYMNAWKLIKKLKQNCGSLLDHVTAFQNIYSYFCGSFEGTIILLKI